MDLYLSQYCSSSPHRRKVMIWTQKYLHAKDAMRYTVEQKSEWGEQGALLVVGMVTIIIIDWGILSPPPSPGAEASRARGGRRYRWWYAHAKQGFGSRVGRRKTGEA